MTTKKIRLQAPFPIYKGLIPIKKDMPFKVSFRLYNSLLYKELKIFFINMGTLFNFSSSKSKK